MKQYNLGDVVVLEELYNAILPWIDSHPNTALYRKFVDVPTCPNCGSDKVQSRGLQRTKTQQYVRFQCQDCGTWARSRFKDGAKNENILTQAK